MIDLLEIYGTPLRSAEGRARPQYVVGAHSCPDCGARCTGTELCGECAVERAWAREAIQAVARGETPGRGERS